MKRILYFFGALYCAYKGEHKLLEDSYEFGGDTERFYCCPRCGCDAITGESFEEWTKQR